MLFDLSFAFATMYISRLLLTARKATRTKDLREPSSSLPQRKSHYTMLNLITASLQNIIMILRTYFVSFFSSMVAKAKDIWSNIAICRNARTFCKSNNAVLTKCILSLRRKECRTLLGVLTGHCLVAAHA